MAFAPDPNDPNNPQNGQPNAQQPMNQPPQTSSGIGAGATGVSSPQGATSIPNSTKAPPVANLGEYLKANEPQTQEMAGKIAGNLNTQAQQVQTDLAAGQKTFEDAVKTGSVTANPDLVARAAASPKDFVMNPDDVAEFQRQMNASYTGPQDFTNSDVYKNLSGEVSKAAGMAPNPSNPNDVRPLVSGLETNPTPGMTSLDTLLLQENPNAMSTVSSARQPFSTVQAALDSLLGTENSAAQNAAAGTAVAPKLIDQVFSQPGGVVPTFTKGVQDRLTGAQRDTDAYNQQVSDYIAFLNDLQSQLAPVESYGGGDLGWTPQGFNPVSSSPTLESLATPDDFANQAALETLLGTGFSSPVLNPALASKAGSFQVPTAAPPSKADVIESILPSLVKYTDATGARLAPQDPARFTQFNDADNKLFYDYLAKLDPNLWATVQKESAKP